MPSARSRQSAAGAFRIEPAVELQVSERDALAVEIGLHGGEGLRISEPGFGDVIVSGSGIGPVTDAIERHIGIVGRPWFCH